MNRRAFLAGLCTCAGAGAGCLAPRASSGAASEANGTAGAPDPEDGRSTDGRTSENYTVAELGYPGRVCEEHVREGFGIRAIDEPATAPDWQSADLPGPAADGLNPDSVVVGLARDGRARAYPVRVLFHHEIVNDHLGGPVLVTFCPLCNSGMVARRLVDGRPTVFAVSGLLWSPPGVRAAISEDEGRVFGVTRLDPDAEVVRSGNLVMYDRATNSYWSQLLARAICGPKAGTHLEVLPAETTTWANWRAAHPETDVLLPTPHSGTV